MADPRAEVQNLLHTVSQMLREGQRLGPEGQRLLAELVDELSKVLDESSVPSAEVAHLTECVAHLVEVAQPHHPEGRLTSARERLERALVAAEAEAPMATGLARQLVDTLANLGI